MALIACPRCNSRDVQALVDKLNCLNCGLQFGFDGAYTVDEPGLVGNLADLQRAGGLIATQQASSFAEGVQLPPGVSEDDAKQAGEDAQALAAASSSDASPAKASSSKKK